MKHAIPFALFMLAGFALALAVRPAPQSVQPAADSPRVEKPEPPVSKRTGLLVDLGNEICPVMKNEVDPESFVEWNHLRVGFCCPGCDKRFLKNPEKTLEEAGIEWRDAVAAIRAYMDASEEHKAHMLQNIKKRWKVVRQ